MKAPSMMELVRDRDVSWWAASFLKELGAQQNAGHHAPRQHSLPPAFNEDKD